MAKPNKNRIVLYYGPGAGKDAKEQASEFRAEGNSVLVIDASMFSGELEDVNDLRFIGDVPDSLKRRIEDAYEGRAQEIAAEQSDESDEITIPEDWDTLAFPELQKLAATISGKGVRSKADAMEIIEAEVERRAEG